jgi:hypothetical protein
MRFLAAKGVAPVVPLMRAISSPTPDLTPSVFPERQKYPVQLASSWYRYLIEKRAKIVYPKPARIKALATRQTNT